MRKTAYYFLIMAVFVFFFSMLNRPTVAQEMTDKEIARARMALYQKMEATTGIPWYYYAGADQYERSLRNADKNLPDAEGLIAIYYSQQEWSGVLNPFENDTNPQTIALFGGIGLDGNNDGKANRLNPEDVLYTFAKELQSYGLEKEDIQIALWEHYEDPRAVEIIMGHARVYHTFGRLMLDGNAFPVPLTANYTIKNTWGDRRGWGGLRIHEGVDIFADYGVKVRATTYGFVEQIGWNKYGGWRIGIRSLNNVYHYYAHLSGYADGIQKGTVVYPGMVIGTVGSSGYGPKGTSGKFPPHLHYGMYRDLGLTEWSFDPYPYLKAWEREERQRLKNQS